ncbi:fimbrial protein [Enterobacter bugandensis]|uniref:fimbrial protein n=1 Tax=Enterobacter bugandensis TaxID=881260 RepID=UPI000B49DFBA|nr:fimbrial protein [Enterobacter bugandensis]QWZ48821.1 fimbrial protein [Enterobacter bugandensis]UBH41108.1 fimbrial protein [Enterobacter bugandensis]UBH92793.1 fimbrial protein [Enterobacter bugandensis]UBH99419.1 fimbrial protein [Enterobacter bugandensis]
MRTKFALGLFFLFFHLACSAEDNVHLSGALVSNACVLPDSDQDIQVNFDNLQLKELTTSGRSQNTPFTIHLQDCDIDVASTVSVAFNGQEDAELEGMLAVDSSSTATGIAIGIIDDSGAKVNINQSGQINPISAGNFSINYNAFVQAEPSAVSNNSLKAGDFSATTTFTLTYQ